MPIFNKLFVFSATFSRTVIRKARDLPQPASLVDDHHHGRLFISSELATSAAVNINALLLG